MMHAQSKMEGLDPDVILALNLSSMLGSRNALTIHTDGKVDYQRDFNAEMSHLQLDTDVNNEASVEDYVKATLPVEPFLGLRMNYYSIPSDQSCGTAANLFLRVDGREHWLGIWNYGRGDIPSHVDAGMYHACIELADRLAKN
jgi:hypothetical protein